MRATDIDWLNQLARVEHLARSSKVGRLINNPFKYVLALFFRRFVYPIKKKEKAVSTTLFYGRRMRIALPAATDIYLTGGKSHDSEIRLARFLILNLREGDHFLDIGAHYGYYTMLASDIVGVSGRVMAFEPASSSYELLRSNTETIGNVKSFNLAVSHSTSNLVFFQFPNLQSEYNSIDVSQFENEEWFKHSQPRRTIVKSTTIDDITSDATFLPRVIKVDVEGAESSVIQGGVRFLTSHSPLVVMEYLEPKRHNAPHRKALEILTGLGFVCYVVTGGGDLVAMDDIEGYLLRNELESDNVVFRKLGAQS